MRLTGLPRQQTATNVTTGGTTRATGQRSPAAAALRLGEPAPSAPRRVARRRRPRPPFPTGNATAAEASRSRRARRCACCARRKFVDADETIFRENTAKFTAADRRAGPRRLRGLGRPAPADGGGRQHRRRARRRGRLGRRPAPLRRQDARPDRSRRLSRQEIRRLVPARREATARSARPSSWIVDPDGRRRRPAGLPQVLGEGGRLRQDPDRHDGS